MRLLIWALDAVGTFMQAHRIWIWVGTYEQRATGATGKLIITEYAAPRWAGLQIDGDAGESSVATSATSNSNTVETFVSAEETACLDNVNDYITELEDFESTVYQADRDNVCDEDDVCKTGTHSSGYYYAVGEACDLLRGPFENARQACLAFPDMDSINYPPLCR